VEIDQETGVVRVVGSGGPPDHAAGESTPRVPRLDEPVLRWLPEIMAASEEQVMPDNRARLGFAEASWHDPASNVRAGARMLSEGTADQGSGLRPGLLRLRLRRLRHLHGRQRPRRLRLGRLLTTDHRGPDRTT